MCGSVEAGRPRGRQTLSPCPRYSCRVGRIDFPVDGDRLAFRFTREEALELEELLDGAAAMLGLGDRGDDALSPGPTDDSST